MHKHVNNSPHRYTVVHTQNSSLGKAKRKRRPANSIWFPITSPPIEGPSLAEECLLAYVTNASGVEACKTYHPEILGYFGQPRAPRWRLWVDWGRQRTVGPPRSVGFPRGRWRQTRRWDTFLQFSTSTVSRPEQNKNSAIDPVIWYLHLRC